MDVETRKLSVLIADDHATVREGLRLILDAEPDMRVIGTASDGADAVAQARLQSPDVVVMDISMPGMNGWTATTQIVEQCPNVKVVTLTRHIDTSYYKQLIEAGTSGYVLKQSATSELVHAIRAAAEGRKYVDPAIARRAADTGVRPVAPIARGGASALSPREVEVLRLISWGYTNKEIASQLGLSVKTVEAHKANGMRKLGMRGRIDVVRYALLHGWLHEA
jgi:DNA-binding NarL/FixJ family response regulator